MGQGLYELQVGEVQNASRGLDQVVFFVLSIYTSLRQVKVGIPITM